MLKESDSHSMLTQVWSLKHLLLNWLVLSKAFKEGDSKPEEPESSIQELAIFD